MRIKTFKDKIAFNEYLKKKDISTSHIWGLKEPKYYPSTVLVSTIKTKGKIGTCVICTHVKLDITDAR